MRSRRARFAHSKAEELGQRLGDVFERFEKAIAGKRLVGFFRNVDKDNSGSVTTDELREELCYLMQVRVPRRPVCASVAAGRSPRIRRRGGWLSCRPKPSNAKRAPCRASPRAPRRRASPAPALSRRRVAPRARRLRVSSGP
jgi:hypothetical protein